MESELIRLVLSVFFSWFIAQGHKVIVESVRSKHIKLGVIFSGGGMPSSHSSSVVSFSAAVFFIDGASIIFLLSALVAIIVMRDAVGVRHMVDEQSKVMNAKLKTKFSINTGHTIWQVVVGGIIGLAITSFVFLL